VNPLLGHVAPALLVVFRVGGLMIQGPVFGSSMLPARMKVFLAVTVGIMVYPVVSAAVPPGEELPLSLWMLAPLVAAELLIGLAIGLLASLPLVAVQTGGLLMGQQMGLGFAQLFNPGIDDEADVVGQILFFMALAGFLVAGGHEAMLGALLESFRHVPLGRFAVDADLMALLCGLLGASFELALRVAAPILALLLLESVAMGFLARTVPQLNVLSLGFPLRIQAGMVVVVLALPVIDDVISADLDGVLDAILEWVRLGAGT
jgi:flagellar biosynthetic protein FliR